VYWTIVHLAYTVIVLLTVVDPINSVPPPFLAVYQPPKA
jgi:hypothetical protein